MSFCGKMNSIAAATCQPLSPTNIYINESNSTNKYLLQSQN